MEYVLDLDHSYFDLEQLMVSICYLPIP